MKVEDCKGCVIYHMRNRNTIMSGCPWFHEGMICPCTTCLVKVMCNRDCKKFAEYKKSKGKSNDEQSLSEWADDLEEERI